VDKRPHDARIDLDRQRLTQGAAIGTWYNTCSEASLIELVLHFADWKDKRQVVPMRWRIHETLPAQFWLKALTQTLKGPWPPFPRFTGFIYGHKTMDHLSEVLNHCIELINADGRYHISERADGRFTQEFSNKIHHHFEVLIGEEGVHTPYYLSSSQEICHAVSGLNHCIHDMEALERALERVPLFPDQYFSSIVMEFLQRPRFAFPDEVFRHFQIEVEFGDLLLHYGQIGKTWWEVFLDRDEEIFKEAIRPHSVLTGEFDIAFGEFMPGQKQLSEFKHFLKERVVDINDPKLAIGHCPLGKLILIPGLSREGHRELVGTHMNLLKISLENNGREILARRVDPLEGCSYLKKFLPK
jgi:hypothetical protein